MGYVLKAVLSSAQHPEYGQIMLTSRSWRSPSSAATMGRL